MAPNSRPIQENHSRGIRTNVYYPETKVENNGIAPSDNSDNDICPDVFDNFHYQVGNVVSNPWKGLAFLRSIYLPLHLKLHGRGRVKICFWIKRSALAQEFLMPYRTIVISWNFEVTLEKSVPYVWPLLGRLL